MSAKTIDKKSLHEIRAIAQAMGIHDIFEKDAISLLQEINLKQQELTPKPQLPDRPVYDARLMDTHPDQRLDMTEVVEILEPHIRLGLQLNFTEEQWHMRFGKRTDEGTIRMPISHLLTCAERIMK